MALNVASPPSSPTNSRSPSVHLPHPHAKAPATTSFPFPLLSNFTIQPKLLNEKEYSFYHILKYSVKGVAKKEIEIMRYDG